MTDIDQEVFANIIADAIETVTAPLLDRIIRLEQRPELKYAGPYRAGEPYAAGCFVSRNGSLWLAERGTNAIPGSPDSGWRMVVKEGRAQ